VVGVLGERPTPTSWQVSGGGPHLNFHDYRTTSFIAVNGFTSGAIAEHSQGTPLLLMDGSRLFAVLDERIALGDLLERLRRHAAQTGSPYLATQKILS
jgi:hypothetical protein